MGENFTYKKEKYKVDDKGDIHEDKLLGRKVGKVKDGNFEIETGIFKKEQGSFSPISNDVKDWSGKKVGKKEPCLLSSACTAARGLPDDCEELTILREFRQNHLKGTPRGNIILQEYHETGSQILRWLERQTDSEDYYDDLYRRLVKETIKLIHSNQIEAAINHYQLIVREYQAMTLSS
jgi:hypothetical protein